MDTTTIEPLTPGQLTALSRAIRLEDHPPDGHVHLGPFPDFLEGEDGRVNMLGRALNAVRFADWTYHYSDDPRAFRKGRASVSKAANLCQFVGLKVSEAKRLVGVK